jgi:hypothetical protein
MIPPKVSRFYVLAFAQKPVLPRRPTKRAPTQQVNVQMKNGLSGGPAGVGDQAKTAYVFLCSNVRGFDQEMAQHFFVTRGQFGARNDVNIWHKQDVHRRLRMRIAKRRNVFIPVNDLRCRASSHNVAKDAFHG